MTTRFAKQGFPSVQSYLSRMLSSVNNSTCLCSVNGHILCHALHRSILFTQWLGLTFILLPPIWVRVRLFVIWPVASCIQIGCTSHFFFPLFIIRFAACFGGSNYFARILSHTTGLRAWSSPYDGMQHWLPCCNWRQGACWFWNKPRMVNIITDPRVMEQMIANAEKPSVIWFLGISYGRIPTKNRLWDISQGSTVLLIKSGMLYRYGKLW